MARLLSCLTLLIVFGVALPLPRDVELMEGHELQNSMEYGGDDSILEEAQSVQKAGFLKTYRNKRSSRYHVLPSKGLRSHFENPNVDFNENDEDFISDGGFWTTVKRSADDDNDVDLSAHYVEKRAVAYLSPRKKRDVIEEEKYYDAKTGKRLNADDVNIQATTEQVWLPRTVHHDEDIETLSTSKPSDEGLIGEMVPPPNAQALHDRRESRGTQDEQWIKIPFTDKADQISASSSSLINNDEMTARMPRVNFVTQNKRLDISETRNDGEYTSIPRAAVSREKDSRAFVNLPEYNIKPRAIGTQSYDQYYPYSINMNRPVYPDEIDRRGYAEDGYYEDMSRIGTDEYYSQRRDPYYGNDDRRYGRRGGRTRFNNYYDPYDRAYSDNPKSRRVIYYTNLPEISRTAPSVDYRYKYNTPNYNKYEERDYKRDPYFRGRYYRQPTHVTNNPIEVTIRPRDSSASGSIPSDKIANENKRKEQQPINNHNNNNNNMNNNREEVGRRMNSHQYPINLSMGVNVDDNIPGHRGMFQDVARVVPEHHRYDHPSFAAPIDDPFANRRD